MALLCKASDPPACVSHFPPGYLLRYDLLTFVTSPTYKPLDFLTNLPGSSDFCLFSSSDVLHLAAYGLEGPSPEETKPKFGDWSGAASLKDLGGPGVRAAKAQVPTLSVTPAGGKAANS